MKMSKSFRIGTRGSKLALWQANHVASLLADKFPDVQTTIEIIKTTGDAILDAPLSEIGGKGVFVKEIQEALLSDCIDIAVHSMKDLPSVLPQGLEIGAVVKRHDPRDAIVSKNGIPLNKLPAGAKVGTGSLRRSSQLIRHYPGLEVVPIRGNVDTRVRKLREGDDYDAIVLAVAGLERMGLGGEITEIIPTDIMVPAPGQGIIAIESRANDDEVGEILKGISHPETQIQATAERAFLSRLGGDCNIPAGCNANLGRDDITVIGIICSPDGKHMVKKMLNGHIEDAGRLGEDLAGLIMDNGGLNILENLTNF